MIDDEFKMEKFGFGTHVVVGEMEGGGGGWTSLLVLGLFTFCVNRMVVGMMESDDCDCVRFVVLVTFLTPLYYFSTQNGSRVSFKNVFRLQGAS